MGDILIRRVKYAGDVLAALQHKAGMELIAACDLLNDIPDADVVPVVHARWEERDYGWGGTYYHCSACGEDWCTIEGTPVENNMKYCPHCGAKMDQEEDKA